MKCLVGGKVVLKDRIADNLYIYFDDKIRAITNEKLDIPCEFIDCSGLYVSTGFIDIHIHGYANEDVTDASYDGIRKISSRLTENGVVAWMPATVTASLEDGARVYTLIRKMIPESKEWNGAEILGVNAEGPFLNVKKKGAHDAELILPPNADAVADYADVIRLITVAPELDEGFKNIKKMKEMGIIVSLGHSDANYDTAVKSFVDGGIDHITHLFNAQTGLLHREPGIVGASLVSDVYTELICDTYHVSKDLFPLVHKMKGDKLCIITDCTKAGGMPDGRYKLGGLMFNLSGIKCTLDDGTIAGSVLKMNRGVENFYKYSGCTLWEAINAASLNPAKSVGIDKTKGSIEITKDADFAVFNSDFDVKLTIVGGKVCYEA